MKVGDFLKKYLMCSNSEVFLKSVPDGEWCKLDENEVKELRPNRLMDMTVQSFSIIDNVLTIYAMDKGQGERPGYGDDFLSRTLKGMKRHEKAL